MDFLYLTIVVAIWALEFVVIKYVYDYIEERKQKRKSDPEYKSRDLPKWLGEAVEALIGIPLGIGLLALPIWMISSITNHAQEQLRDSQWANCANTQNTEGEYLTKKQCEYYRDVLNGKYVDLDATMHSQRDFDE